MLLDSLRLLALSCLGAGEPAPAAPAPPAEDAARALHRLFSEEWDHALQANPTWASRLGDRRWNDRWEDVSPEAHRREHEHDRELLGRLKQIDREQLSPADRLNLDLFRKIVEVRVEGFPYGWHLIPLDQREGIQTADDLADALRFETVEDFEDWSARLRGFGGYMEQTIALLREGMRERMVQPKVTMKRLPAQIEKQIVEAPEASPFYKPFQKFPREIGDAERKRLAEEARGAVRAVVVPAYRRFLKFFTEEYLPACYDQPGAWQMPRAEALYAYLARKFTTTSLTPREIHETGLREVARIREAMEGVKERAGFRGTLAEYFHFLRTDPRFFCKSPEELLLEYRAVSKRIDPHLVKLFRTLPRTPYGVEAIPDRIAPDTTAAYYRQPAADGSRAGTFFANLYRPETRPRWEMMALTLHEAVPGHHLQIALAQEQADLPQFRRHFEATAYVEGWALYAESLGEELGLYDDPHSKMGQLAYEMWRAVRLVVDTGIHALRWDRERAIQYFRDHAPKTDQDIINEVDRYLSWPGQALAYKIGELKIQELRARAKRELGRRFDLKEFHDVVLLSGALPLDLLEARVDAWIRERGSRP